VAVDHHDIDRCPGKTARRHQPAEAGADDHDSRPINSHGWTLSWSACSYSNRPVWNTFGRSSRHQARSRPALTCVFFGSASARCRQSGWA